MKTQFTVALIALVFSIVAGAAGVPLLGKIKAKQTILKYVETHKGKEGTPTMGGLFFILPAVAVFFAFGGASGRMAAVACCIGLAFMAVGFIDDFIKIKFKRNEGLKAYQKMIFLLAIAIVSGIFAYYNGITVFYIPFTRERLDFGIWTIPVVAVIFVAITNSVNLTDGLDGLAGSACAVYLVFLSILISVQMQKFGYLYLKAEEYENLILLSSCLIGALCGFLVFNSSKARVFMGDTGSLSLGGFLGAIGIFSSNSFFIPIIGITFVVTSISVIVQVAHFKRTGRRVFLMAPLHHHFQLKGYTETQISYCYSLLTAAMGALSVIFCM